MRPQCFRNLNGRFQEVMPENAGPWFAEKYLGRGLVRVDWNMDGLPDFIVSNINSPLAVMKNTSTKTGHFLKIKLVATQTSRDAIGARVSLNFSGREVTRQLAAGDGYMASNERVIHFGLGDADSVRRVTIQWPSGATSLLNAVPNDSSLTIVEGSNLATLSRESSVTPFVAVPDAGGQQ
jgi:hypothetical protein